jgi:hypothetical protein
MVVAPQFNNLGWFGITEVSPCIHQGPTLFECIPPSIGLFGLIANDVSECGLRDFASKVSIVPRLIPERTAKAMDGHPSNAEPRQNLGHCNMR